MELNSRILLSKVHHERSYPVKKSFRNSVVHFLLDLDELGTLQARFSPLFFGRLPTPTLDPRRSPSELKKWICESLKREVGLSLDPKQTKVFFQTQLKALFYVFNPVSFFFVETGQDRFAFAEVGNTFHERKLFYLGKFGEEGKLQIVATKNFYVSPFIPLGSSFDFKLSWPLGAKSSFVLIGGLEEGAKEKVLIAHLSSHILRVDWRNLLKVFFPALLQNFKVIGLIHWHALGLYLKRVPYIKKADRPHLQQGILRWKN